MLGLFVAALTAYLFFELPHIIGASSPYQIRRYILIAGSVCCALLLAPALRRLRSASQRGPWLSRVLLPCCAVFFAWFILHFGNLQFGAWDFNITIDTGWRQILGQRPYVDFISPNPPLFNLGIWAGFKLFGVSWNAQLATAIVFCVATFAWEYWLLRRLRFSPLQAVSLAFATSTVTSLIGCFWWYNGTSEVIAALFLLSALVCARAENAWPADWAGRFEWISYAVALGLLLLAKPNIAGLMICVVGGLLLISARRAGAFLVATAAGVLIALLIAFLGHVSLTGMIASYRGIAVERGGLHFFATKQMSRHEKYKMAAWEALMGAPLLFLLPGMWRSLTTRRIRDLAYALALMATVPIALYCMLTNAEVKESETPIVFLAVAVVCFGGVRVWSWVRSAFVGLVIAAVLTSLYFGASRVRVLGMGPGMFFETNQANYRLSDLFFKDLRTTERMVRVQGEVHQAAARFPGKTFFGPRLEYDYAVLKLTPPPGWPVYYQPGTSFARRDVPKVDAGWQAQQFQTLIFLHGDRTFYEDDLLNAIARDYREQPGFADVDVYTRR